MKFNNILTIFFCVSLIIYSCHTKKEVYKDKHTEINKSFTKNSKIETKDKIVYTNQILNPNIKTVQCHNKKNEQSLALINLGSNDKLLFSFDDLNGDKKNYLYTIIHCNANWEKSDLIENEYIDGFSEEYINDYEFSFNTIQKYTHYKFEFPSTNMKPILSGNYILKIYEESGKTIVYKRFIVLDKQIYIDANVKRATLAKDRNTKHEIDLIIKHPNFIIGDPFSDITIHIKQNNREDNSITDLKPRFVRNDELIYDYEDANTFWGNNEFRYFDIKSLRYQSERIKKIVFDSTYNHVYLFNDKKRTFDRYSIFELDINGKFIIKSQEGWNSAIEADYTFVHFKLPIEQISYGELYLLGAFSDWELKDDFKLKYNLTEKRYEGSIYLKQGYYNYHYALKDTNTGLIDVSFIEGTHYQTRNDYYIYVYYRSTSDRFDQCIGFVKTSSQELF